MLVYTFIGEFLWPHIKCLSSSLPSALEKSWRYIPLSTGSRKESSSLSTMVAPEASEIPVNYLWTYISLSSRGTETIWKSYYRVWLNPDFQLACCKYLNNKKKITDSVIPLSTKTIFHLSKRHNLNTVCWVLAKTWINFGVPVIYSLRKTKVKAKHPELHLCFLSDLKDFPSCLNHKDHKVHPLWLYIWKKQATERLVIHLRSEGSL